MKRRYTLLSFLLLFSVVLSYSQGENFNLIVQSPASVAGTYDMSSTAAFGALDCASEISGELALGNAGTDTEACANARAIGLDVEGKIAVVDRGNCNFIEKAEVVQDFGAIAIIVCNNVANDTLIGMSASDEDLAAINITIPTFFMRMSDCATLKGEIDNGIMAETERLDFGFVDGNADDEVLFTEGFSGGLNGWEAEGLFCGNGVSESNALWEWRDQGELGRGLFSNPFFEMISTTPCDGFVVFDSDFLDSGGTAQGAGSCPVFQEGILTSPEYDLTTTNAGDLIGIKFTQGIRPFDSETYLEWTTDAGATWEQLQINTNIEANETSFGLQRFPLVGVDGTDKLQVRFRFARDYYFWAIDDIQIINFTGINAKIENTFYTPLNFAVPITHADADTFLLATDVINNGAEPINVRFNVDIFNNDTGELVHADSIDFNNIAPQDTAFIAIQNGPNDPRLYVPNELEIGVYRMEYAISVLGEEEANLTDNTKTFFFAITDGIFSKGAGTSPTAFRYAGADAQWGVGAFFPTANGVGKFDALGIEFAAFNPDGGSMENFLAEVALLKLKDDLPAGFFPQAFENENSSYLNHPNLDVIYSNTHVFTDTSSLEFVTLDLTNEGIDQLEPGSRYLVMVFFDDNVTSDVGLQNYDLTLVADDDTEMSGVYLYLPDINPSWYTGFVDFTPPAPIITLAISLTSPVDDVPLPDQSLKIYPNPADAFVTAELNFDTPTDVSLIVASIDGKIISVDNLLKVGTGAYPVDVSALPNGTYMLRVSTEKGTKTLPIIVQH